MRSRSGFDATNLEDYVSAEELYDINRVYREYVRYVWRVLRYLGVPEREIADVGQEVFIVVYQKLGEFRGHSTLRSWIYGICLRIVWNWRRKGWNHRMVMNEERVDRGSEPRKLNREATWDGPAHMEDRQLARRLLSALEGLDDSKRDVFVLYEIEGLPMSEVASILDCPVQTAYSRLHAARDYLHGVLKAYREDAKEAVS